MKNHNNKACKRQNKDKQKQAKELFNILLNPMSRRMSATALGFTDMTYMVTQNISDWLKDGRAQVVGHIRCKRSNRIVEMVTTNSDLFNEQTNNQLTMF